MSSLDVIIDSVTVIRGGKVVLSNLSAELRGPGLFQVIGPNGSGKTTLLLTIMGFIKPHKGRVLISTQCGSNGRRPFSYMPQSFSTPSYAPITVYEFVKNYLALTRSWPRLWGVKVDDYVVEALELVGIPRSNWEEKISKLSSGMVQRAMLARTLALDAPIVLLDEPLSSIDPSGKAEIADLLARTSRERTVIVTSHDPLLLVRYTKKVLLLGFGEYVYGDTGEVLRKETLQRFYKKCAIELETQTHITDWH
ncbi:MAG: ATP-binding cassette domain-containing protein [Desulfurococcaceae archaeon]